MQTKEKVCIFEKQKSLVYSVLIKTAINSANRVFFVVRFCNILKIRPLVVLLTRMCVKKRYRLLSNRQMMKN